MKHPLLRLIEYILRITIFLTFFGHGIFAIKGNIQWLVYLETVGFSIEKSKDIIIYIGILDIAVALIILLRPFKYIILWAILWAFCTALIRPISGESVFAFIERGVNWGAPLVLYLILKNDIHEITK